jgi:hypothetical protein
VDRSVAGTVPHVQRSTACTPGSGILMSDDATDKREIRKTALILSIVALFFYLGFILLGVLNAG